MNSLDEIPRLEQIRTHAGTIHAANPLLVESIPERWAYAVSVPLELSRGGEAATLPLLVSAEVDVQEGELGLLLVAGDLTTMLGRLPPTARPGRQTIELVLETESPAVYLVFRNHTAGGRPCVFTLERVTIRPAPADALTVATRLAEVTVGDPPRLDLRKLNAAVTGSGDSASFDERAVFDVLRRKWGTVPAGLDDRRSSTELAHLPDAELRALWSKVHHEATADSGFAVRGWYQLLYRDILRGKKVLEIGSGMGIDGVEFARHGARMTFVDIVESNLAVIERLCRIFGVSDARFVYLEDFSSFDALPADFDVVWCQGSLINAPFDFVKKECAAIVEHLAPHGRWIELAYPRERWRRDGEPRFSLWGTMTDGEGTPWMEWYDLARLLSRLAPARFAPVLALNFHNDDFNWFDLVRID